LVIPTDKGELYFKASSVELQHEVALTRVLEQLFPEIIPEILASDEDRGWMMMVDGGNSLRATLKQDRSLGHWEAVLPLYAELQIRCIDSVEGFMQLDVPDRRLSLFPGLLDHLLSDAEILRLDQEGGISSSDRGSIRSENISDLCSRLAAYGIPESLDHGDFHDGNIFLQPSGYAFFDWGDSSITHPFFSLRTAFVSLENTLRLEEDSPEFNRLAEIYLEPWERYQDRPRLLQAFDLARRLWALSSALRWQLVVSPLQGDVRAAYSHAVPGLLMEFLDSNRSSA
jgi:hypothetical protein